MIEHVIEEKKKNPRYSAAQLERSLSKDILAYEGTVDFKKHPKFQTYQLTFVLSTEDSKIYKKLMEMELDISLSLNADWRREMKEFEEKGLECLIKAFKTRISYLERKKKRRKP